ncbi:hypothetical protein GcM3_104022 [Golovinomyces cichoracearum]|uniref:Uncharacterized protein n=1 Tax=Golovinomyces cichoracearum TaxID=62708 RepID=A0A420I9V6_9PEZI|nr:hypothetical protein GcM3_104022 [Golovinomyces cichoracearum]
MTVSQALPTNITEFAIFSEIAKTYVQSSIEIDNESVKIMDLKQHIGFASSMVGAIVITIKQKQ